MVADLKQEIVVKSELAERSNAVNPQKMQIAREAYHLAQLMERDCDSNVFLRGYKFHTGFASALTGEAFMPIPEEGFDEGPFFNEWRYYLEYCSRETLYHIMLKYKAWGYHLPEAFIWWVFLCLIDSCQSMDTDRRHEFRSDHQSNFGESMTSSYMLHNDMSWRNIFMQEADDDSGWVVSDDYPQAKMADFGLSQTTFIGKKDNQAHLLKEGTIDFIAPEKRRMREDIPFYPFKRYLDPTKRILSKRQHPVGPEANLWGAGIMVYLLMTLEDSSIISDELDEELDEHFNKKYSTDPGSSRRRSSGGLCTVDEINTRLPRQDAADYSWQLKELVRQCTRIQPQDRPTAAQARTAILAGIQAEEDRLFKEFDDNIEVIRSVARVVLDHDVWNDTPRGPCDFGVDLTPGKTRYIATNVALFWREFHEFCNDVKDPDVAALVPPGINCQTDQSMEPGQRWVGEDYVTCVSEFDQFHLHMGEPLPAGGRALNPAKRTRTTPAEMSFVEPQSAAMSISSGPSPMNQQRPPWDFNPGLPRLCG